MRVLLPAILFAVLIAGSVRAAEWDVVPSLSVRGTYTDNLSLAPDEFARADWVTQLIPAISVAAVGSGLKFDVNYAPEITHYARGQEEDQTFHRGNAVGTAVLADELLFFDAGLSVDQYNVSSEGPITDSNVNTTGNRATVGTAYASPYLVHHFGNSARVDVRYTYSAWNSDDESTFNNTANSIDLGLASGKAYRLLSWNLTYSTSAVDYTSQPDIDTEVALATARQLITSSFGLLAQIGDENYERSRSGQPTGESDGGTRWGVGFEWAPSPRARVAMAGGERFFGNAYFLDLNYRTRLLALRAGYSEDITTSRAEFFSAGMGGTVGYLTPLNCSANTDDEACQREVESDVSTRGLPANLNGPVNFFSADPFLQKRFEASLALQGVRNVIVATAFLESREELPGFVYEDGNFAQSSVVDQTGISLAWNLPVTARTFGNLGVSYENDDFPGSGREDNLTVLTLGINRQFQPRLSGALTYTGRQNDSNDPAFSYTENNVTAALRMEF